MNAKTQQGRGELTDRIKRKSEELLGYEISVGELRLMPYVQYCVVNQQALSINPRGHRLVTEEEAELLRFWLDTGYIVSTLDSKAIVTKEFWDAMSELIWLGYADLRVTMVEETTS